jgi:hypothetical protein
MSKHVFYHDRVYDCWMHRPLLKVIVNPILRKLQFFTKKPWVISSIVEMKNGIPVFKRYSMHRVECVGSFIKENCDKYITEDQ